MSSENKKGQIQVIFGPMFSGKTSEMLTRIRRYEAAKYLCTVIKYESDTRYHNSDVATHDLQTHKAISTKNLADVKNQVIQSDVIGIDEGQFYLDIVDFCDEMVNMGKIIIVAALDGDYKRRPFNRILELIPKAENVVKKSAVCCCGDNASFSKRLCDSTEVEMVGGSEKYMAVCRTCYGAATSIGLCKKV